MSTTMTDRPSDPGSLARRLERLEQQNERLVAQVRRLKAVVTVVLILAGIGLVSSLIPATRAGAADAPSAKVVRANAFFIVDKNGVERGSFGYNDAEQAVVLNMEPDKNGRINMGIGRDYLGLRMTHGNNDINMGYTPKGGTYVEMVDKEGKTFFEQRRP